MHTRCLQKAEESCQRHLRPVLRVRRRGSIQRLLYQSWLKGEDWPGIELYLLAENPKESFSYLNQDRECKSQQNLSHRVHPSEQPQECNS